MAYHTIAIDDVRLFFCICYLFREYERSLECFTAADYRSALANVGLSFFLLCKGPGKKCFNSGQNLKRRKFLKSANTMDILLLRADLSVANLKNSVLRFNYGFIAGGNFLDKSFRTENGYRILPGRPGTTKSEVFFPDHGNHGPGQVGRLIFDERSGFSISDQFG